MNGDKVVAVWQALDEHDEATVREAERVLCAKQIAQEIGSTALLRLNHGYLNVLGETTDRRCGLRFLCGDMTW